MIFKFFRSVVLGLTLVGCAGLIAPTTFEQRVAYVDAGLTAAATTIKERVVAKAMTKEEGQKYFDRLTQAARGSDMAKGVIKPDGKICSDELTCLKFAQEQLLKLEVELKEKQK